MNLHPAHEPDHPRLTKWRVWHPRWPYRIYGESEHAAWKNAAFWEWSGYISPPSPEAVKWLIERLKRDGYQAIEVPADEKEHDRPDILPPGFSISTNWTELNG